MADLIDRDALMKEICGNECDSVCDEECENVMCNFYDYIMDAPAVNRWISCSERLPENDAKRLVYTSDKRICMARWYGKYYDQGAWYIVSDDVPKLYRIKNVPFWMPLPEPPKEK